jgi:hypothetical protein
MGSERKKRAVFNELPVSISVKVPLSDMKVLQDVMVVLNCTMAEAVRQCLRRGCEEILKERAREE